MAEQHLYRVEGQQSSRAPWTLVFETADPVDAMECAHEIEGYFWRRVFEDGRLVIDRM